MTNGGILRAEWRTSWGRIWREGKSGREVCLIRSRQKVTCWEDVKFRGENLWEGGIEDCLSRKGEEGDSIASATDPGYSF